MLKALFPRWYFWLYFLPLILVVTLFIFTMVASEFPIRAHGTTGGICDLNVDTYDDSGCSRFSVFMNGLGWSVIICGIIGSPVIIGLFVAGVVHRESYLKKHPTKSG